MYFHWVSSLEFTVFTTLYCRQPSYFCTGIRRCQMCWPQTFFSDNFPTTFRVFFIIGSIDGPDLWITFWSIFCDLDLKIKYGISYICIVSQKWSDHEMKSKRINCTLGRKCDHWVWPWPWHWPWIFFVKYGICYILTKNGPIAMKSNANVSNEH